MAGCIKKRREQMNRLLIGVMAGLVCIGISESAPWARESMSDFTKEEEGRNQQAVSALTKKHFHERRTHLYVNRVTPS